MEPNLVEKIRGKRRFRNESGMNILAHKMGKIK
jgi:hypothetical protein